MTRRRGLAVLVPLALLAGYAGVWRPIRAWSAPHVLAPVLRAAASPGWHVEVHTAPPGVHLTRGAEIQVYNAPAGRAFLVPALVLGALAPTRLLWLRLLGLSLGLGAAGLLLAALGVADVPGAWAGLRFVEAYVTVPLTVGLAFLWLRSARADAPEAPGGAAPNP